MMRAKKFLQVLLMTAPLLCGVQPAHAGPIFLSGDTNIVNPLVGSFGQPIDPGNQLFFRNVLSGGSQVVVQGPVGSPGSVGNAAADVNNFYNSLSGVSSSILSGPVTGSSLAGANLFVSILPAAAYTPAEISALSSFESSGGSIFFLGDNSNFLAENARINATLSALGSNLTIINDAFDDGFHTATGSQIATDPFTAGVSTFTYAAPSRVSGGTLLFFGTAGQSFVAYQPGSVAAIPEPSSLALLGVGVVGMAISAAYRRQRNKTT